MQSGIGVGGGLPAARQPGRHSGRAARQRPSAGQQTGQIAQPVRCGLRLVEFEANLQVAAVQVKLGNLIFLQEFDQLFQILYVLLVSFVP